MTDTTMKMLDTMPTTGQFVTVHEFGGELWSSTYKWDDETVLAYDEYAEGDDCWKELPLSFEEVTAAINILGYFVKES